MTLPELVSLVREKTGVSEQTILEIVCAAWPEHSQFTPTQAALVVNSIFGKHIDCQCAEPKALTNNQIWGEK